MFDFVLFLPYKKGMVNKRGRPPVSAEKAKAESLEVRLTDAEKRSFLDAAEHSGLSLSSWVRERLRRTAAQELRDAGKPVAFLADAGAPPKPKAR